MLGLALGGEGVQRPLRSPSGLAPGPTTRRPPALASQASPVPVLPALSSLRWGNGLTHIDTEGPPITTSSKSRKKCPLGVGHRCCSPVGPCSRFSCPKVFLSLSHCSCHTVTTKTRRGTWSLCLYWFSSRRSSIPPVNHASSVQSSGASAAPQPLAWRGTDCPTSAGKVWNAYAKGPRSSTCTLHKRQSSPVRSNCADPFDGHYGVSITYIERYCSRSAEEVEVMLHHLPRRSPASHPD